MTRVLVEWSSMDHRWDSMEVQLARKRISKLAKELSIEDKPTSLRTLQSFGVVEDMKHVLNRRFGMLYQLPKHCAMPTRVVSLSMLLPEGVESSNFPEPLLGERFELARALADSVYELHASGWLHEGISSHSVIFFTSDDGNVSITKNPYLIGFGYSRPDTTAAVSLVKSAGIYDLYQHPELRKNDANMSQSNQLSGSDSISRIRFRRSYDLYSLGLVLLEIGLWDRISEFSQESMDPDKFTNRLLRVCERDLGHRMGRVYSNAVMKCIRGVSEDEDDPSEESRESRRSDELMDVYWAVVNELAKCHCR
jgi:serine/threonine protein kinase